MTKRQVAHNLHGGELRGIALGNRLGWRWQCLTITDHILHVEKIFRHGTFQKDKYTKLTQLMTYSICRVFSKIDRISIGSHFAQFRSHFVCQGPGIELASLPELGPGGSWSSLACPRWNTAVEIEKKNGKRGMDIHPVEKLFGLLYVVMFVMLFLRCMFSVRIGVFLFDVLAGFG